MLLFSLILRQDYLSFIKNRNQKKCHQAHDPTEIYGMGQIYALEEGRDLREDQPQSQRDHGNEQCPSRMGASAYAGPKQRV
jgi:hypothetical protein